MLQCDDDYSSSSRETSRQFSSAPYAWHVHNPPTAQMMFVQCCSCFPLYAYVLFVSLFVCDALNAMCRMSRDEETLNMYTSRFGSDLDAMETHWFLKR